MFILFLVRFRLLSGHLLGNSCLLDWPYVLFVFFLFVISIISRFGFGGWIWVLIASVPDLCILFTFIIYTNFEEPQLLMLHVKFQHHMTSGSGEDF